MALVHEMEKSGNWLFKRRGWLPVFFLIPAFAFLYYSDRIEYNPVTESVFIFVGMAGQLIRALTVGRTPKGTSGRNIKGQVASRINTTGIYSIVRHPLYIGNLLMWLGPVLFLRSLWFTLFFCLLYWLYYERIMFAEEQYLRKKFGEQYDRWSENVRAFLPTFRHYRKPDLPFSFRNVLKREYHGLANMFIIFSMLDLARNYINESTIRLNPIWLWSLISVMIIWLIIRILVKTCSILNVKGR
jgi:protein-S-isoprenylcysteine O-methyltransferase Ste14